MNDGRVKTAFEKKQHHLLAALEIVPDLTNHGTTIGDDSEANWARVLREFLPERYGVGKGTVIDSRGATSQQIDLIIYDPQYSPLLAKSAAGDLFVPAEAVYAVFEVKQEMKRAFFDYAGEKIESVRKLHRTSVPIPYARGTYPAKQPIPILGGLLTTRSAWRDQEGEAAIDAVLQLEGDRRVDIGCALSGKSFNRPASIPGRAAGLHTSQVEYSGKGMTLMFFLVRLFTRLQEVGTVAAVDTNAYLDELDLRAANAAPLVPAGRSVSGDRVTFRSGARRRLPSMPVTLLNGTLARTKERRSHGGCRNRCGDCR